MTHYAHMIHVNRLQVDAYIGFYEAERSKLQKVEISFRLYFPDAPPCTTDDEADFIDYGTLCKVVTDYMASRKFNLIEYTGSELFRFLREYLDGRGHKHIKLWLCFNKIQAPVPGLLGGASFSVSDLAAGDTVAIHT